MEQVWFSRLRTDDDWTRYTVLGTRTGRDRCCFLSSRRPTVNWTACSLWRVVFEASSGTYSGSALHPPVTHFGLLLRSRSIFLLPPVTHSKYRSRPTHSHLHESRVNPHRLSAKMSTTVITDSGHSRPGGPSGTWLLPRVSTRHIDRTNITSELLVPTSPC
jgi:hypothetical protein